MNNATILVVDDEPQIRRVLQVTLSNAGYDVVDAKNGEEGIQRVLRERPDLVLLDADGRDDRNRETAPQSTNCGSAAG